MFLSWAKNYIMKKLGNDNNNQIIFMFGAELLLKLIPWLRKQALKTGNKWDDKAVDALEIACKAFGSGK